VRCRDRPVGQLTAHDPQLGVQVSSLVVPRSNRPEKIEERVIDFRRAFHMRVWNEQDGTTKRKGDEIMNVESSVKAGGINMQHNETLVRTPRTETGAQRAATKRSTRGVSLKSSIKAGGLSENHNETLVRTPPTETGAQRAATKRSIRGVSLKSSIKAGVVPDSPEFSPRIQTTMGGMSWQNHNATLVRERKTPRTGREAMIAAARGTRVRTNIKAGVVPDAPDRK
jgi:hypothetical protein